MRIDTALADTARYGGFFAIRTGAAGDNWRPITDCYADGFTDLITMTAQRNGSTEPRVAASLVQFSLASRLWSPVLACALIHGVVPDLIDLHRAEDSAELLVGQPTGALVDDESKLAAALFTTVVIGHLEPFAAGLRVKLAPGLLYGNAASAMVAATRALYGIRPDLRDSATRLARSLLEIPVLAGTGTVKYNLAFRRHSCCLYYRIADGAKCSDCGLVKR
ncbi:(2Fe-2S)-binding protein [Mycobacterium sp. IDR2000157661]|uniref:(2Fe-2S)-binding protein n=1 Tax=Mycobacterium sp. IDR2000157661 TaxID=2867005 RepID=UPI001EEF370C|nr:(2Fe-2S)-binding protein [Mycobacterium sp. IDR2000157661]ULE35113.1 ferric iron reductase [Mycobacterium sp. IDR2000157661]